MTDLLESVGQCLPPKPVTRPERLVMPAEAWDCHFHVIGLPPDYPLVEPRHYTPHEITPAAAISVFDSVGIRYGTAVQVSVHGTDNRRLLGALKAYPTRLKGVAVIDTDASDRALAELKAAGVVGLRLLDMKGGVGVSRLEALARRCREMGWHIQLCLHGSAYPNLVDRLCALPVPIVIDHMGWFVPGEGVDGAGFQAVMHLLRNADCWVKLSGPFRLSAGGPPYADVFAFVQRLIEAAPDRLVWGSDWPHVGITQPEKMPQYGDLLDFVAAAVPDTDMQRRIFCANPARLYGLPKRN